MKITTVFFTGCLAGAAAVWFGLSKEVIRMNDNAIAVVDRFTGKASEVFVSHFDSQVASTEENERLAKWFEAHERGTPLPQKDGGTSGSKAGDWRPLTEAEIEKIEFKWNPNGIGSNSFTVSCYNPFDHEIKVDGIRIEAPAIPDGKPLDRRYEVRLVCSPLRDNSENVSTNLEYSMIYEPADGGRGTKPRITIKPTGVVIRQ